jgi:hypothetical protein
MLQHAPMRATSEPSDELLTLQELVDLNLIPVGKRTIAKLLESGELPGANFKPDGGRLNLWRIKKSDAEEFVRRRFRKKAT